MIPTHTVDTDDDNAVCWVRSPRHSCSGISGGCRTLTVAVLLATCVVVCSRRQAREQKAYAKQVQAEKQKERTQEKKRQIQQVQQLRKQREKSVSHMAAPVQGWEGC